MTVERDPAAEETVRMPIPKIPDAQEREDETLEEFDPEKTLVRENWESIAIRRVAPHVAAVHSEMARDAGSNPYGWESEGLRRLAEGLRRVEEQ